MQGGRSSPQFGHRTCRPRGPICYSTAVINTWCERKRFANLAKHGLDFAEVTFAFLADAGVRRAKHGRLLAVGRLDATNVVAVIFAPLGSEALAIVSMRPANKKEVRYAP